MKVFKEQVSSNEIIWFLISTLLIGAGIKFLTQHIEINAQMRFIDYALSFLIVLVGIKFVSEKI
tara:strand:+ start:5220 stop:5411 length:192 start_codon:yes stop_codon:yes gene_type:complete